MKRVFVVHRWEGRPDGDWYPWLKKELESKEYEVTVPEMPDTEEPNLESWVAKLRNVVGMPDKDTHFVGHSIGCQTIFRYLASLDSMKVGSVVCVGGWFFLKGLEDMDTEAIARPWLDTPVDFERVHTAANEIHALFSDNDYFVPLEINQALFQKKLGAKIVIEHEKGHFTADDGVKKIPSLLQFFK
jgi:uncharacterized protein